MFQKVLDNEELRADITVDFRSNKTLKTYDSQQSASTVSGIIKGIFRPLNELCSLPAPSRVQ